MIRGFSEVSWSVPEVSSGILPGLRTICAHIDYIMMNMIMLRREAGFRIQLENKNKGNGAWVLL
jgi:hypothetical protein